MSSNGQQKPKLHMVSKTPTAAPLTAVAALELGLAVHVFDAAKHLRLAGAKHFGLSFCVLSA